MASDLVELIRSRIGEDFDGECHLTANEALSIIGLIEHLRDNSRIESLEREIASLRAEKGEARKLAIKEAAAICDGQAKYFRDLSTNPACLTDIRWNSQSEARHTMQSYAERHETDAAAIRNMGGEG